MNLLDRVIAYVSPSAGIRRAAARVGLDMITARGYEGAETTDTRGGSWDASRISPQVAIEEDAETTRHRARELVRNDTIGGTVESRANLVVGTGFTPQATTPDKAFNLRAEASFKQWAKRVDAAGVQSLWQLTRQVEKTHATDGEAFVVASFVDGEMVLEAVDADRVSTPPELSENPKIRMGVEKNAKGRIVAYHIQKCHPYDPVDYVDGWERISADRVFHLFDSMAPGQLRGIAWLARCLNRLKDAKDLDEAAHIAAHIEACFAAFVQSEQNPLANAIGNSTSTREDGTRLQKVTPGLIHYTKPGEKVTFADPSRTGGSYGPLQESNMRRVSAALNYAYEMVQKNWSGVSFSGGRLVLNEVRQASKVWQKLMVEKFLSPTWEFHLKYRRKTAADLTAYLTDPAVMASHTWTPPGWSYALNPGEDVRANTAAVLGNQKLLADVLAENGYDLEEFAAARAAEIELMRPLTPPQPETGVNPLGKK